MKKYNKVLSIILASSLLLAVVLSSCANLTLLKETEETEVKETESSTKASSSVSETAETTTSVEMPSFNVPEEAAPISMQYDLGHKYDMTLELDADAQVVRGTVRVDIVNQTDATWNTLVFRDYPSLFTADGEVEIGRAHV